jgi:arabinogalactan endo-1,4-beta-galactosidase
VLGYTARKASDKTELLTQKIYDMTENIDKLVMLIESQEQHIMEEVDEIVEIEKEEHKNTVPVTH